MITLSLQTVSLFAFLTVETTVVAHSEAVQT